MRLGSVGNKPSCGPEIGSGSGRPTKLKKLENSKRIKISDILESSLNGGCGGGPPGKLSEFEKASFSAPRNHLEHKLNNRKQQFLSTSTQPSIRDQMLLCSTSVHLHSKPSVAQPGTGVMKQTTAMTPGSVPNQKPKTVVVQVKGETVVEGPHGFMKLSDSLDRCGNDAGDRWQDGTLHHD